MTGSSRIKKGFNAAVSGYLLALIVYLLLRWVAGDRWWWLAFLNNFTPYYFAPLPVLLPLALLLRLPRAALRTLPLIVLAALLYGPEWMPNNLSAAAVEGVPLKVITFNILPINPDIDAAVEWIRGEGADLVLLQELPREKHAQVADTLSDGLPHSDYRHNAQLDGSKLTLSRYPIITSEDIDIGSWWIRRLTIRLEDSPIAVYNVHMAMPTRDAGDPNIPVDYGLAQLIMRYDETQRNTLIRALLEIIEEETLPYVVAGDFNTSDQAIIYQAMAAVMRDSFREAGRGLGATWPAATGEEGLPEFIPPLIRIDYVWHSAQFGTLSAATGPNLRSDHLPLLVNLDFLPSPPG